MYGNMCFNNFTIPNTNKWHMHHYYNLAFFASEGYIIIFQRCRQTKNNYMLLNVSTLNREIIGFVMQMSLVQSSDEALFFHGKRSWTSCVIVICLLLMIQKLCGISSWSLAEKFVITG